MLLLRIFLVVFLILSCSNSFKIYLGERNQQDTALLLNAKYREKDLTVKTVNSSIHKFNISLGFFDCKKDENKDCLHQFRFVQAVIYSLKSASIVKTLNEKQLKDTNNLIEMLQLNSRLDHENLLEVKDTRTWRFIKEKDKKSKNYIVVKLKEKSSALYQFVMEQSKKIEFTNMRFLFTFDEEIAHRMTRDEVDENQIWLMRCRGRKLDENCIIKKFQHLPYFKRIENAINKLNKDLYFKFIEEESQIEVLKLETLKSNFSLVILEVGDEMLMKKVEQIAKQSSIMLLDSCHCFIFKRKDVSPAQRIRLRIYSNLMKVDVILSAENSDEVNYHANKVIMMKDHQLFGEIYRNTNTLVEEKYLIPQSGLFHYFFTADNEIDCPMSYSVAKSKFLQNLIRKDKKGRTLPRVTDVSYQQLVKNGDDFQVLLFTSIHNPRSMAALVHFYDIHQYFLKNDMTSPLNWVECSDWPDVCQLADVITYPMMIFVRNHDGDDVTTTMMTYDGMWEIEEMLKSILLHGLKWPHPMSAETVSRLNRFPFPIVCGNVRSTSGERIFGEAARKMGGKSVFIKLLNDEDLNDSFMIYMKGDAMMTSWKSFSSVDDFETSLKSVMTSPVVIELNEKTFYETFQSYQHEIDGKMIVVCINKLSPSYNKQQQLLNVVEEIAKLKVETNCKLLFTWMRCEPGSSGDYIFEIYTDSNIPPLPIACVQKENATVTSFKEIEFEVVNDWIQQCENNQLVPTFTKMKTDLQQLTSSDDHLKFYQFEGIIPSSDIEQNSHQQSMEKMEGRNGDPHPHTEL